jgi:hypothetical protein
MRNLNRSEELDGLTHSHLDVDGLEVVPLLLEEGSKEVKSHNDVLSEFIVSHELVTGGNIEAGNLLELPLDGSLNIVKFLLDWLVVSHWLREHTNSVKNWTKDDWDFLNKGISSKEEGVFLGPLFDLLLILVEFLEVIKGGNINFEVGGFDFIRVLLIGNNANLKVWSWDIWKSDGSNKSLILLWIIILKGNLKFNSLLELSFLSFFSHFLDAFKDQGVGNFTHICNIYIMISYLIILIKKSVNPSNIKGGDIYNHQNTV